MAVRKQSLPDSRAVTPMNSQQWGQHAQVPCQIKVEKYQHRNDEVGKKLHSFLRKLDRVDRVDRRDRHSLFQAWNF